MDTQGHGPTTLTREVLYERVWKTPAVQLAKEIGVSDVAIAKACKRHQIPKPPPGFWAKKAAGKASRKPPLKVLVDPKLQTVKFVPSPPRIERAPVPPPPGDLPGPPDGPPTFLVDDVRGVYERLMAAPPSWDVPPALRNALPVVAATREGLRRSAKEKHSFSRDTQRHLFRPAHDRDTDHLNMLVGRRSIDRSVRLMDALLKVLLAIGFSMKSNRDGYSSVVVVEMLGVQRQLGIRELTTREPHVPTAQELKDQTKYSFRKPPKWDYLPNGVMRLAVFREHGKDESRGWADGKLREIEQMLPDIVVGLLLEVDVALDQRIRASEANRRQAQEAQARYEAESRRKKEQTRVDALIHEVERWEQARRIRRYLRATEDLAVRRFGGIEIGSNMDRWLNWAESAANELDPLVLPPDGPVDEEQAQSPNA